MPKKHAYEFVKEYIENFNCKLLSTEYVNTTTPLIIQCECGEIFKRKFGLIRKSPICKCKKCTQEYLTKNMMKPFEEVLFEVKKKGYRLLITEKDYKGINYKYDFICPKGHKRSMYLSDLLNGHECKICATEKVVSKIRLTYQDVKDYIESFGYKLLSEEYKNADTPLIIKCLEGHITDTMTYANFKAGHRCLKCYNIKTSERQIVPFEERKEYVESFGFKILINKSEYKDGSEKILMQCPKGHEFEMCIHDFKQGNRCPKCNESKGENKISKFLDNKNIEYIRQYRIDDCRCLRTLPFDFYLSKYNCYIEYDGKQHYLYGGFGTDLLELMNLKYRDDIKTNYCKDNNIKLIRIPYWEFNNIEEILKLELNL